MTIHVHICVLGEPHPAYYHLCECGAKHVLAGEPESTENHPNGSQE